MATHMRLGFMGLVLAAVAGCQNVDPALLDPERVATGIDARALAGPDVQALFQARGSAWPPAAWDADALTIVALSYHPSMRAARARLEETQASIASAGEWPNPTLSVSPEFNSNAPAALTPWIAAIRIDWVIETGGKRGRRLDRARATAAAAAFAYRAEAWGVRRRVVSAWIERVAFARRIASLQAETELLDGQVRAMESRVADGAASHVDLAAARLSRLGVAQELESERTKLVDASILLADAIGIPMHALDGIDLAGPSVAAARGISEISRADALGRALYARSDVLAGIAEYAVAEANLRLELARQYPDLHLGPGYQYDQAQDKWSIGLSFDLPLLNQNQGAIGEAAAARTAAAVAFEATQTRVISEVDAALARRENLQRERDAAAALARERAIVWERARAALAAGAIDRSTEELAALEAIRADRMRDAADFGFLGALGALEAAVQPATTWLEDGPASLGGGRS
jgi:outer membrane protein TolC